MSTQARSLHSPRLASLSARAQAPPPAALEQCELCGAPVAADHRHLIDLRNRELLCACRACALLFDRTAAGGEHFRLIGDRRLALRGLVLDDVMWDQLRIPVDMAFFFESSADGAVRAFYPSPMGPTESELELGSWVQVRAANPVLDTMEPDTEALLVNRSRGARDHWLVPLDDCYRLVALIRTRWRGFTGGREVWEEIARFYEELARRARPAPAVDPISSASERS